MSKDERRIMSRWNAIALRVHDWAMLSPDARQTAIETARRDPKGALRCYRAILWSLPPALELGQTAMALGQLPVRRSDDGVIPDGPGEGRVGQEGELVSG